MKKHKVSKEDQASSSNGAAEVFVLPPELLAKLGINLANIKKTELPQTTHLVKDTEIKVDSNKINDNVVHNSSRNTKNSESYSSGLTNNTQNEDSHSFIDEQGFAKCLQENKDASSIIETANLMKESVFLSPTFFHVAPTIPDNEESMDIDESVMTTNTIISSEYNTLPQDCIKHCLTVTKSNSILEQNTPQLGGNIVVLTPDTAQPGEVINNVEDFNTVLEYTVVDPDGNVVSEIVNNTKMTTKIDKISKHKTIITCDEHPDEAYLSDCSNSYSGCSPESLKSEVNKQNKLIENINEEIPNTGILNHSQVKEIDVMDVMCCASNNIATPITSTFIVMTHKDNDDLALKNKDAVECVSQKSNKHATDAEDIVSENILCLPLNECDVTQVDRIDLDINNESNNCLNANNESKQSSNTSKESAEKLDYIDSIVVNQISEIQQNSKLSPMDNYDSFEKCMEQLHETNFDSSNNNNKSYDNIKNKKHHMLDSSNNNQITNIIIKNQEPKQEEKITNPQNSCNINKTNYENTSVKQSSVDSATQKDNKTNSVVTTQGGRHNRNKVDMKIKDKEKQNENSIVNTQDKVKEIAVYLSKIANERKIKKKNDNKNFEKEAKGNPITSKLCIQGVEKPGGKSVQNNESKCFSVSKTYQKSKNKKQIPGPIELPKANETLTDSFQVVVYDTSIDGTKVNPLVHQNEFCICYDFGNLAYYDCEMLYEHIHFLSHKAIDYESETLYSIYNEDCAVLRQVTDFIEDAHEHDIDDATSLTQEALCWNEINLSRNEEEVSEMSTMTNTPKIQKTVKKSIKQKQPVASNKVKESEVKCGMYNKMKSKKELETHNKKEHNFAPCEENKKQLSFKSNATSEPSTASKSSKKSERMKKISTLKSCGSEVFNKTNENISVTSTTTLSKNTPKIPEKVIETGVNKSLKNFEKNKKTEKISSHSVDKTSKNKSKKQSNHFEEEHLETERQKRKSLTVSNTTEVPVTSRIRDKTKKEQITSANVSTDAPSVTPRTSKRRSQVGSNSLKSLDKVDDGYIDEDKKKSHKTPKTTGKHLKTNTETVESIGKSKDNKSNKSASKKDTTSKYSGKPDLHTLTKIIESAQDKASKTVTKIHSNCATTRSTKRSLNNAIADTTVKRVKLTEPSVNLKKSHKYICRETASESSMPGSEHTKDSNTFNSTKINVTQGNKVPNEFQIIIEDPLTNVEVPTEESAIPDKCLATSLNSSALSSDTTMNESETTQYYMVLEPIETTDDFIKCGVCEKNVKETEWINHIAKAHNYIAWRYGQTAMDSVDEKDLKKHLKNIAHKNGGLLCSKCGLVRKGVKTFLQHIRSCTGSDEKVNDSSEDDSVPLANTSRACWKTPTPVTCAVCNKSVQRADWIQHIGETHKYLAWTTDDRPVDLHNPDKIKEHLKYISKNHGGLMCYQCRNTLKSAKNYQNHINRCGNNSFEIEIEPLRYKPRNCRVTNFNGPFTCAVCEETVEQTQWIEHIRLKHKYLAWTSGEQPVDLNEPDEVKEHLKYISKNYGGLTCNNCTVRMNYVKNYLNHLKECVDGLPKINRNQRRLTLVLPSVVTCGVCKLEVEGQQWIKHIQIAHDYMAWMEGQTPLDQNDPEKVKEHLDMIARSGGELVCTKCGETRNYANAYLTHVAACARTGFQMKIEDNIKLDPSEYMCGVCRKTGELVDWTSHAMKEHYNVAWRAGEIPINLRNPYAVEKHLKLYKRKFGLVCRVCKASRSSCYGFYAHILTCGKTEEELEAVHDVCELCNNKYLCIYRNQHMAAHRDSDMRRERREQQAAQAELEPPAPEPALPGGRRRAAERAKKFIQNNSINMVDGVPVCGCGATFQELDEYTDHSCALKAAACDDDSDVSVKIEEESDEPPDDAVDSAVSEDEEQDKKKKRVRVEGSTKPLRLPYKINNPTGYLNEAYKDFVKLHYATTSLFNDWRDSECQIVPPEDVEKYLPQVMESCKVRFGDQSTDDWTTFKRFESKKNKGCALFVGGAIQCVSWAPAGEGDERAHYLAVSAHRGPDQPRHDAADRVRHDAALQIWDFGHFDAAPRCVACVAHEAGVAWALDWCPSGARDAARLGLLAVACSNGSAYVFAVPCPVVPDEQLDPLVYKLKPVAELRLSMTPERRTYQATCIKWSPQKEHSTIIVGYSDGTTALYDLNTESPFLKSSEDGVSVYYPYQDRRSESTAVTGVGLYASMNEQWWAGGQYSASSTGGTLCGAGAGRPAARTHLAASAAHLTAHWPSVMLAGDLPFVRASSEVEWCGGSRRVGAARVWATCARCGRAASAASSALRSHRNHPVYTDIKKLIVALLLMVPLGQKRKRKADDDLSLVVEPLIYDDAAAKYGLELTLVTKTSRSEQMQAQQVCNKNEFRPERFPLSDIVALAFCPSRRFHDRIVVATHTGLIFVLSI